MTEKLAPLGRREARLLAVLLASSACGTGDLEQSVSEQGLGDDPVMVAQVSHPYMGPS